MLTWGYGYQGEKEAEGKKGLVVYPGDAAGIENKGALSQSTTEGRPVIISLLSEAENSKPAPTFSF